MSFSNRNPGRLCMWALTAGLLAPSGAVARDWPDWEIKGDANRNDIPVIYKWDLSYLYKDAADWENEFVKLESRLPELDSCKKTMTASSTGLEKCLLMATELREIMDRLGVYAHAEFTTNRSLSDNKIRLDRFQALGTRLAQAMAFIEPELLAADPVLLRKHLSARAGLADYDHYIDDLVRRRAHVLSPAEEAILALTGDLQAAPSFMHSALEEDVKFPDTTGDDGKPTPLTMASFARFRTSDNRDVRREAVGKFLGTLKAFAGSFAASLDMAVKANILNAKARGYGSALESSLDANAVPVSVYDTLLATTEKNLPRTLHRYVDLRKRLMKLDAVHYYDLYVPMLKTTKSEISYPEAVEMVKAAVKPLGPDYNRVLGAGLDPENGWVDVFPASGKRPGAYCNSAYKRHPIVFLNFLGELNDVFTLAHEFGHALHFHLASEAQPFTKSNTPIFVAEIASTFNEELLLDHLLSKAKDKDERLYLLNRRMENLRTTVFRQTMFAEFERAIHEEVEKGGALTADGMAKIYSGLVRKYYGPDFVIDEFDGYEWAFIPHFYYNYYVYQYATGLMSAIALSRSVLDGGPADRDRYLDFLRSAGSDYPVKTLQTAGVDLTTSKAMEATFDLFAKTLDEIESLTK